MSHRMCSDRDCCSKLTWYWLESIYIGGEKASTHFHAGKVISSSNNHFISEIVNINGQWQ